MKTLLLLRHAKSSWKDDSLGDHDRPLNDRGKQDAPRMGKWLAGLGLQPQLVLCSTATRAQKTARKLIKASGYDVPIELFSELYLATPATCLEVLRRQSDQFDCLMLVGHNPGMAELLYELTRREDPFPTAALAEIEADIDCWTELGPGGSCTLRNFWRPRELETDL